MQPATFDHPRFDAYELLDSGGGEKLERFGDVVLVRPDPQAIWRKRAPKDWKRADLTFVRESDRGGHWVGRDRAKAGERSWEVAYGDARFSIRPTRFKHVGVFPEQASNWEWVRERAERLTTDGRPRLLNLFGYTGVASVLATHAGFEVTHVDASKTSLQWLRDNIEASGLDRSAIRVVLDDALAFVRREVRRGSKYHGILLDPPHYGRGPKGEKWEFEASIAPLLDACARLLQRDAFCVLSTYAIGTSPLAIANLLGEWGAPDERVIEAGELALPESSDGAARLLPCGFCARWSRGAASPDHS